MENYRLLNRKAKFENLQNYEGLNRKPLERDWRTQSKASSSHTNPSKFPLKVYKPENAHVSLFQNGFPFHLVINND